MDDITLDGVFLSHMKPILHKLFQQFVVPANLIYLIQQQTPNIVTESDKSRILAEAKMCGDVQAASMLLDTVTKHVDWFQCLVSVLGHPDVQLGHVAEKMKEIKEVYKKEFLTNKASQNLKDSSGSISETAHFKSMLADYEITKLKAEIDTLKISLQALKRENSQLRCFQDQINQEKDFSFNLGTYGVKTRLSDGIDNLENEKNIIPKKRLSLLQRELERNRAQIDGLAKEMETLQEENRCLSREKEKMRKRIAELEEKLKDIGHPLKGRCERDQGKNKRSAGVFNFPEGEK
ncbi:uncharacterized protein LOC131947000 isoform X1 [Physella acuta]|uniref:uncharacterized protein LOC131947000 isoform X1 n=1 Tax=Physella acuta TaxID=109671 RepID=UPI0027DBC070|nr:uncharacterized protein LOC131947000 isoform X1 [Physella acuta]